MLRIPILLLLVLSKSLDAGLLDKLSLLEFDYPEDYCVNFDEDETFDYIVVGAGPAGSTVARRLSEDSNIKVLLIEAGGNPPTSSDFPVFAGVLPPEQRFLFCSPNNKNLCFGHHQNCCPVQPGKVLGGSSTVNLMMGFRGNKQDQNDWVDLGIKGWSYDECLPYFKKLEDLLALPITDRQTNTSYSSKYHSTGGPMKFDYFKKDPQSYKLRQATFESIVANGIPFNSDCNGKSQMGVTNLQGFVDSNGLRYNAAKAYLQGVPNNLRVCKYSMVHKVLFKGKRAVGVKFKNTVDTFRPKNYEVYATKEIILSAGAFNSAPILERSGIGQRALLEDLGIEVIAESPQVGENLMDHYANFGAFQVRYRSLLPKSAFSIGMTSLSGFINTTDPKSSTPDIQLFFKSYDAAAGIALGYKNEVQLELDTILPFCLLAGGALLRQGKPGYIHIRQKEDPDLSPDIRFNYYDDPQDVQSTVKSTRLIRKILADDRLSKFNVKPYILSVCRLYDYNSEEEIMCSAKHLSVGLYHTSGPTAMGSDESDSVLDSKLRVKNVECLRVVDGGSMPLPIRSNSEYATIMLGEKAADIIKNDHCSDA